MSEEISVLNELAGQTKDVLGKVYEDAAHPTMKSLGNTISLLPRTIGVWLSKWEKWIINGEESIRLTAEAVREKAKAIPEEKLSEPEPYVAIPAIQQLSYCNDSDALREMYANLLVSSMNIDTKAQVHPAYIDIIKQLTPDEAKLLALFPTDNVSYYPLLDLEIQFGNDGGCLPILRNYSIICQGVCENPEQVSAYLENLDRLKIIEIFNDIHLTDDAKYNSIRSDPNIQKLLQTKLDGDRTIREKRKSFRLTEFGRAFIEVCVGHNEADKQITNN